MSSLPEPVQPVRVWDLPTRLFHWLLAACIIGSVVTGSIGGNALTWHFRLGYAVMTLLLFRLAWGLVGGRWSRFRSFLFAPATLLRYLRGQAGPGEHLDVGHNPLGAGSVFAMLLLLCVQVGTGLVADDEIATTGPLNRFVASATALSATAWHKGAGKALILLLVALHVSAIVFYKVRRGKNLVGPMVGGDKLLPPGTPASADGPPQRVLAAVLVAVAAGAVSWVVRLGG